MRLTAKKQIEELKMANLGLTSEWFLMYYEQSKMAAEIAELRKENELLWRVIRKETTDETND